MSAKTKISVSQIYISHGGASGNEGISVPHTNGEANC